VGKKSRVKQRSSTPAPADTTLAEVGPRQPCPCGSGRRYKHCHGRSGGAPAPYVARTFAGLADECDWAALREIVPSATAPLRLRTGVVDGDRDRDVTVCSLLPLALPALVRDDGSVWLGLQVQTNHGDLSRDLAYALELALAAEPGSQVSLDGPPPPGPRLQDLLDPAADLEVTVHDGFDFWLAGDQSVDGQAAAALEAANEAAAPTRRLTTVQAAYWTRMSEREYVRWVLPHDEDRLLDALARLHAVGSDRLGDSGRLLGMFRAHALLTPVWELASGTGADGFDGHMASMSQRLDAALADDSDLSPQERSARNGLANRQLTIR